MGTVIAFYKSHKRAAFFLLAALFYTCLIFHLGYKEGNKCVGDKVITKTETLSSTDRLPRYISTKPLYFFKFAKNEAGSKKVEHHFPEVRKMVAGKSATSSRAQEDDTVTIPISQMKYQGTNYTAYVSGFHQALDSIEIRERVITNTIYKKRSRWNLGISAGYACTPQGLSPYIGIGIVYNIFR